MLQVKSFGWKIWFNRHRGLRDTRLWQIWGYPYYILACPDNERFADEQAWDWVGTQVDWTPNSRRQLAFVGIIDEQYKTTTFYPPATKNLILKINGDLLASEICQDQYLEHCGGHRLFLLDEPITVVPLPEFSH